MKKYAIVMLCLICAFSTEAQRRLPGQMGIQVSLGVTDGYKILRNKNLAYNAAIALSRYTASQNKLLYGVEYLEKHYCYDQHSIPVSQFTAECGYYYNFLSNRGKDIFINLGGSLLAGYETSNWGKMRLPDGATLTHKDGVIGGAAVTLEIETFVCDRIVILINLRERMLIGSSTSKFHNQVGIGLKYII